MKLILKNNSFKFLLAIFIVGGFAFFFWNFSRAVVSGNPCAGNICGGSVALAGETINYWYTEHVNPAGEFKIRFQAPASAGGAVRFSIGSFPVLPGGEIIDPPSPDLLKLAKYFLANPDSSAGAVALDTVGISSGRVIAAESVFEAAPIDFVIKTYLPDVEEGNYGLTVSFIEFNQSTEKNITFYVDAAAPLNDEEWRAFGSVINEPCSDGVDNDLDFVSDCRDIDCDDLAGGEESGNDKYCRYANETLQGGEENNCYDRFDNDFDKDGINSRNPVDSAFYDYNAETGLDCRDIDCENKEGADTGELCWYNNNNNKGSGEAKDYPESCRDSFNNDADDGSGGFAGKNSYYTPDYLDCADLNCWRMGTSADTESEPCPTRENFDSVWCLDGADNDYDNGLNSLDKNPATGADCRDYDCSYLNIYEFDSSQVGDFITEAGVRYPCAFSEARDESGKIDPARCFDGADNDLDLYIWNGSQYVLNNDVAAGIDCGDSDCIGVENPDNPGEICFPNEFEISKYQVCNDGIDNDGDDPDGNYIHESSPIGGYDCEDDRNDEGGAPDCWQMFGNCGPCPEREDLNYSACADAADNDLDNNFDCADYEDCEGNLGKIIGGAFCAVLGREEEEMCFDTFDNDDAGGLDCADTACFGANKINPYGVNEICGLEDNMSRCSDTFDNDRDGDIDCLNSSCSGIASCAPDWVKSSCREVPIYDYPFYAAVSNTVSVRQYANAKVEDIHRLDIKGMGNYSSLQIKIGSKYDTASDYPYDFCNGTNDKCAVSGTGDFLNLQTLFKCDDPGNITKSYALIQNTGIVGPFELFITCPMTSASNPRESYLIDVYGNGGAEAGITERNTELFENTPPQILEIEVGGADDLGVVAVPYGGSINLRGVPTDPDLGIGSSGICGCELSNFSSLQTPPSYENSSGNDCRFNLSGIKNDDFYDLTIETADGAGNQSFFGYSDIFTIDVVPVVERDINLGRLDENGDLYPENFGGGEFISPFYKSTDKMVLDSVQFRTADNGSFPDGEFFNNGCELRVYNNGGAVVYSGEAFKDGSGSVTNCGGEFNLSSFSLPEDGEYFVSVSAVDEDNYRVTAPRHPFYVCDAAPTSYPEGHTCRKADFDQDGAAEGIFAKEGLYEGNNLVCDNCPNLNNPDQFDFNANGVGDVCEINGFCVLDNKPCRTSYDCEKNICAEGSCTVDFSVCAEGNDCAVNYCSTNLGECFGAPMCSEGYCVTSDQCITGNCSCQTEGGFCDNLGHDFCFLDADCLNYCDTTAGICALSGEACVSDADCSNPRCVERIIGVPPDAETIYVCDNDETQSCAADSDCYPICIHGGGECSLSGESCFTHADCGEGEICEYPQTCSINTEVLCFRDSDCPDYPSEFCGTEAGVCDGDNNPCASESDCLSNECLDGYCSVTGDVCSEGRLCIQQICKKITGNCEENGDPCKTAEDCEEGEACVTEVGFCEDSDRFCLEDGDCLTGEDCLKNFGVCDESGTVCVSDINCPGEENCVDIGYPWLETKYGGIYTKGRVEASEPPPAPGLYNATYCIKAGKGIDQFTITSGANCLEENIAEPFNYPGVLSQFQNIIGRLDMAGIEAGQYGEVRTVVGEEDINSLLGGKIYVYNRLGDRAREPLIFTGKEFLNGGAGTIIIYGNLEIRGNITYTGGAISAAPDLASVGFVVLDDPGTPEEEGNVYVSPMVRKVAGAFYVENKVNTGEGGQPLTVSGLIMAKQFEFKRFFASRERGSEQIIYDGRAQVNPPPGMADLTKALPILQPFE